MNMPWGAFSRSPPGGVNLSPSPVTSHTYTRITHLLVACGNMASMPSRSLMEGYLMQELAPFWGLPAKVTPLCMGYEQLVEQHSHSMKSAAPSRSMILLPGRVVLP